MNRFNNIFNKNEVENKLKDFKEGKDYKVTPAGDGKWFYDFLSDRLKNFWGDDRIVVNRVIETDSNKDYDYYGRFENYQDGSYRSFQSWSGNNFRQSESYKRSAWWENGNFPFHRDPEAISESLEFGRISGLKPKRIEPNHDLKWKHNQLTDKLKSLLARPESDFGVNGKWKKEFEIAEVKKDIKDIEREIDKEKGNFSGKSAGCCNCGFEGIRPSDSYCMKCGAELCDKAKGNKSDLHKENQELRQELSEVKNQLAQVLDELKKLKHDINGKDSEKLEKQIVQNEKLIKDSENISVSEIQEQVNKSQALMSEFNTSVSSTKDNKGNGSLPYVIGGSAILASAGIIGYFLLKKNKRK
jgi:hypothetical protein